MGKALEEATLAYTLHTSKLRDGSRSVRLDPDVAFLISAKLYS